MAPSTSFHRSASFNARRRGVFIYPPIIRGTTIPKQTKPTPFLTILLIFLPFAVVLLYTVDIRTHILANLRKPLTPTTSSTSTSTKPLTSRLATARPPSHPTTTSTHPDHPPSQATNAIQRSVQQQNQRTHNNNSNNNNNNNNINNVSPQHILTRSTTNHISISSTHSQTHLTNQQPHLQQLNTVTAPPTSSYVTATATTDATTTIATSSTTASSSSPAAVRDSAVTTAAEHINSHQQQQQRQVDTSSSTKADDLSSSSSSKRDTSTTVSSNGIAPLSLPNTHPNHHLLNEIRAKTKMTPRWPMTPRSRGDVLKTYGQAFSSMLVSHKLKVVYIPVFKVATTAMMWNIAVLENNPVIMEANRTEDTGELMKIIHDMSSSAWHPTHTLYDLSPEEISKILDDPSYLKFGFVRNPYDRIVSAYVDKVVRPEIFDEEYQDQMYSLFGSDVNIRRKVNETRPTFLEFLEKVKDIMALPRVRSDDLNSRDAYEDNMSRRDMHWRPQVELLHPDIIHLDFVGHFDRLETDRHVVIQWMHRNTNRRLPRQRSRRLHSTDPKLKLELFNKLRTDETLRNLLLTIYKEDFSRFHFSTDVPRMEDDIAK